LYGIKLTINQPKSPKWLRPSRSEDDLKVK